MTSEELNRIKLALQIALPRRYLELVSQLPVVRDRGTTEGPLWDVPDKLIEQNIHLRKKRHWPAHMFCIGEDGGGSQFVLDVREPDPSVLEVDFEDFSTVHPVSYADSPDPMNLTKWYQAYIQDLELDGLDITEPASPEAPLTRIQTVLGRALVALFVGGILLVPISGLLSLIRRITGWSVVDSQWLGKVGIVVFAVSGALLMWFGRERPKSRNGVAPN